MSSKDLRELLCTAAWEGSVNDIKNLLAKISPDEVNKANNRGFDKSKF